MKWLSLICVAGLFCALPTAYSQELTVGFQQLNYPVDETAGSIQACVAVLEGSIDAFSPQQREFSIGYFSQPDTAVSPGDYTHVSGTLVFNDLNRGPLCFTIDIINNADGALDESFSLIIFNQVNRMDLFEDPGVATVTITGNGGGPTPVTIGFQSTTYNVVEGSGVLVCAQVVPNNAQLDRDIIFSMSTSFGSGSASTNIDYNSFSASLTFGPGNDQQILCRTVLTREDTFVESTETLTVVLETTAAGVTFSPGSATVFIEDNDIAPPNPCNSSPCDVNAVCTRIGLTNGFTCACNSGFVGTGLVCVGMGGGDDPHFSIILPSGKLLCFTVQGERNFAFNLVSTDRVDINSLFVADSVREEVTWMGALGIIVQGENYYGANKTSLRFDAKTKTVSVGNKLTLKAAGVDTLHFKNGKLMITEKGPEDEGNDYEHPSVCVNLEDVGLHFHVTFFGEHLDIFWNSVTIDNEGNKNVHGLVGQFLRDGVKIDTVSKLLLLPKMEPVPIMRRPIWGFMEREVEDNQLCWTAMNAGYQGDGLIQGNYLNYLVNDVLDDGFVFKM